MIDWEHYWLASQYVMEFPQCYDCSITDTEDVVREMTTVQATTRYNDLKQVKDVLEDTLELLYIDMQTINNFHHVEAVTPEPRRQQQWKCVDGEWIPVDKETTNV